MIKVKVTSPFVDKKTRILNKIDSVIEIDRDRFEELKEFVEIIKNTNKKESNEG